MAAPRVARARAASTTTTPGDASLTALGIQISKIRVKLRIGRPVWAIGITTRIEERDKECGNKHMNCQHDAFHAPLCRCLIGERDTLRPIKNI